jgi:hypothetical protein
MQPTPDTPEKASSAAVEAKKTSPKPKKAKKPMAKKAASKKPAAKAGINKSEEIRKIANAMKAKNEKPRPVVIMEILKKQGIEVSSPQISIVLKKMGFRPRKRRTAGAASATGSVKKTGKTGLSVEDLIKAKKMADEFGGAEKLVNAISALVELQ